MNKARLQRWLVSWNKTKMVPEKAEKLLATEGIKIVQKGIQPFTILKEPGRLIVVEATSKQIKDLLSKFPAWMVINNNELILVT